MPIYSFVCQSCGQTKDVVCKAGERNEHTETCASCGDALVWSGIVEGGQKLRADGAYEFKAILENGSKVKTAKHKAKRSDS